MNHAAINNTAKGYSDTWNTVVLTREITLRGTTYPQGTPLRYSWRRPDGAYLLIDGHEEWVEAGCYVETCANPDHLTDRRIGLVTK